MSQAQSSGSPGFGPQQRWLIPFTSFSEPDQVGGSLQPVWFAFDEARPLAFFAGVWTPWTCVRKIVGSPRGRSRARARDRELNW